MFGRIDLDTMDDTNKSLVILAKYVLRDEQRHVQTRKVPPLPAFIFVSPPRCGAALFRWLGN